MPKATAPRARKDDRTRERLARDIASIMAVPRLHEHTRRGILWKAIWDYTEREGKISPRFAWTPTAKTRFGTTKLKDLRREHVIPMKESINYAMERLATWKPKDFTAWFEKASMVCVVTKEENDRLNEKYKSRMPKSWDWETGSPFARYDELKIGYIEAKGVAPEAPIGEEPCSIDDSAP